MTSAEDEKLQMAKLHDVLLIAQLIMDVIKSVEVKKNCLVLIIHKEI